MIMPVEKIEAILSLVPGAECTLVDGVITEWNSPVDLRPSDAEINIELVRLKALQPWKELRRMRDLLLAETDYYALTDNVLTEEMRVYRQALRDLPQNTIDPTKVVFPAKPIGA